MPVSVAQLLLFVSTLRMSFFPMPPPQPAPLAQPARPPPSKSRPRPILKVFLEGLYDEESTLSRLRGCDHVIKAIWTYVHDNCESAISWPLNSNCNYGLIDSSQFSKFPLPVGIGININMMPFICSESFDNCRLPEYLRPYWGMIEFCVKNQLSMNPSSNGEVFYLTIQESEVEREKSQRRSGLHVGPGIVAKSKSESRGTITADMPEKSPRSEIGVYISSNVHDSTRAWNCKVQNDLVGKNGNIEHVREFLPGKGELLRPHQVYMISDRTPYEDLPMKETTTRQFFRIIASEVRFWFDDHYTANPMGVLPDPSFTEIVHSKDFPDFEEEFRNDSNIQEEMNVNDWKEHGFEQMRNLRKREEVQQKRIGMVCGVASGLALGKQLGIRRHHSRMNPSPRFLKWDPISSPDLDSSLDCDWSSDSSD